MRKLVLTAFSIFMTCVSGHLHAEDENLVNGLKLLDQKKYEEAITAFDLALKESPAIAAIWEKRGYAYFCIKNHYQAINDYTLAIILSPNNPLYYERRALAYMETANYNAMKNDLITAARMGEPCAQELLNKYQINWKS